MSIPKASQINVFITGRPYVMYRNGFETKSRYWPFYFQFTW